MGMVMPYVYRIPSNRNTTVATNGIVAAEIGKTVVVVIQSNIFDYLI